MSKHNEQAWQMATGQRANLIEIPGGEVIAHFVWGNALPGAANAERAVACVNALAGKPAEWVALAEADLARLRAVEAAARAWVNATAPGGPPLSAEDTRAFRRGVVCLLP